MRYELIRQYRKACKNKGWKPTLFGLLTFNLLTRDEREALAAKESKPENP